MGRIASDYFNKLFAQSDVCGISEMVQAVNPFVTEHMNRELTNDISEMEIRMVLFAMHPEKTPRPDWMTTFFFPRFWPFLKGDLVALVRDFFRTGKFDPKLNETNICLIPKVETPKIMAEFRPISLCNTNRMCSSGFLAFKTDMSKTYDRVEWDFLKALLSKKAEREEKITGIKIARDSPPISHFLFADDSLFFCQEDEEQCSTVMNIIGNYGKASGQEVNFDKSSIMFGKKVTSEVKDRVKSVIGISKEGASGQEVNFDKSSIMFGKKVTSEVKDRVKSVIGISKEGGMGSYLGIPESLGGSRVQVFCYVRHRMNDRVNGWTAKFLSKGGKEVLQKSVALALPTHVMSCFKLPQGLTTKLTSAISNFWWSSNGKDRGFH
ncbi:PREDICTED: uncharacterized protein LOC104704676 [Camelina sativa]|uniref:Uncharacterized protein LOC104704676 n=1 Tax=Camelina sativa TaxID=90675 RepID=A0ABM0T0P4_CAMSA|nr:PREDICTED: uncharacterized protein LOC104704676 [Camelina sativa]